jgi:Gas vesicle protein G
MGLFTGVVTLPLLPVRGVVWLAERVQEQAERELWDPRHVVGMLEEIADARAAGEIDEDEAARIEEELVGRLSKGLARTGEG